MMRKKLAAMMALALTMLVQVQAQEDGGEYQPSGLADIMAAIAAAKIHQDSIDTSSLMAVYDYECQTQDADGKAVTDRMKLCLLVGQHCTRSFPYRKFRKEREWASGNTDMRDRTGADGHLEFMEGYDFGSDEELPMLAAESYCFVPEVWMGYPEGMVTVRDAIPPTIYETQEARDHINWKLTDDTVTISGYLCKTATCQLYGRQWTVRYCEDIPTTAGPWKLRGLPGLIVEAEADGIHRFTLTDIQHTAAPIYYETSAITVKTNEAKLIKNRIKTFGNRLYLKNPTYYITDHPENEVYTNDGLIINGVYVNDKAHVYQPLEKE